MGCWTKSTLQNRRNCAAGRTASRLPLSPCIYCIYFDIDIKNGDQFLFADDLILLIVGRNWEQVESKVGKALTETGTWCTENNAQLNLKKTKVLFVNRRNQPNSIHSCDTVPHHKTLGIVFDQHLNYSSHIEKVCQSMNRKTAILRLLKNKFNFSTKSLVSIYKCFRSNLIFGTYWIWSVSLSQFKKLETALNKMTKIVFGFIKNTNTNLVYSITGILLTHAQACRHRKYKN